MGYFFCFIDRMPKSCCEATIYNSCARLRISREEEEECLDNFSWKNRLLMVILKSEVSFSCQLNNTYNEQSTTIRDSVER